MHCACVSDSRLVGNARRELPPNLRQLFTEDPYSTETLKDPELIVAFRNNERGEQLHALGQSFTSILLARKSHQVTCTSRMNMWAVEVGFTLIVLDIITAHLKHARVRVTLPYRSALSWFFPAAVSWGDAASRLVGSEGEEH